MNESATHSPVKRQRIGFVGAGLMGHGAAKHILKAGYPLTIVGHRNRAPIDDLVSLGATEAASVKALTEASDIVFLCLPDTPRVEQVLRQPDGLIAAAREGLYVLDMTTSLPGFTRAIAAELAQQGVTFLDAPMTRTPQEAEEGRLNVLLGGDEDDVSRVRAVVATFCENVWHVGDVGAAHAFKLVNNFLVISNIATILEASVAASRFGIDLEQLVSICSRGGASSVMLEKITPYAICGDDSTFQAHTSTLLKDITYYNQMADDSNLHSMMSKSTQQVFQLACNLGESETLAPRLYDVFRQLNLPPRDG